VNPDERQLLESTARSLLKLQDDIADRLAGIEIILQELFRSDVDSKLALARLRVKADLLRLKGKPCAYLETFVRDFSK
jgi:hypothetical protein